MFTKRFLMQYSIPKITADQNYSVNLNGLNQVCSSMLIWISNNNSDISQTTNVNYWHLYPYQIDQLYITNGVGQNLMNNLIIDKDYNNFTMNFKYELFYKCLKSNTVSKKNDGEIYSLDFGDDQNPDDFDD